MIKKKKVLFLISILLLMLVSACNPGNSEPTDESPLEVINLQITSSLEHWLPQVADCAGDIPEFGIYTRVTLLPEPVPEQSDLVIRLGSRIENDTHVVVLGTETITVVVGSEVPLASLSFESLQNIYSGELSNWGQVPEIINEEIDIDQPIQTLSYPDGHSLRDLFSMIFLQEMTIGSQPMVFSTLDRLNQILKEEPYAIGYLLERQAPDDAKILTITDLDPQAARQLVLAVTAQEPEGKLRQLLLCLQDSP